MPNDYIEKYITIAWKAILGREPYSYEVSESAIILNNSNARFIDALKRITTARRPAPESYNSPQSISVVINTCNRGASLKETIMGLLQQTHKLTEIIVVVGPCTDGTEEMLLTFGDKIRIERCPQLNISISRNIGIMAARGDIVAFIDDDAVPAASWCEKILEEYTSAEIGAVGGWVLDYSGVNYQTKKIICDRFGGAKVDDNEEHASDLINSPGVFFYSAMIGTNSSFRRDLLFELGGFDEEYEYFLDETDVCVRLIDASYKIILTPKAIVYHRSLPSHIRSEKKIITNYYPIFKNTLYFILKNNGGHISEADAVVHHRNIYNLHLASNRGAIESGHLSPDCLDVLHSDYERSLKDALSAHRRCLSGNIQSAVKGAAPQTGKVKGLPLVTSLNVVLLCRTYDLLDSGIANLIKVQAIALQQQGHTVHVLTLARDDNPSVVYQAGIWIHRLRYKQHYNESYKLGFKLHDSMWNYSMTMYEEVCKISESHAVDVVETPIWDCEGVAFALFKKFPHVVNLETTMGIALRDHPDWRSNNETLETIVYPAMACETYIVKHVNVVRALSNAILKEFEAVNQTQAERERVIVCPAAVVDHNRGQVSPEMRIKREKQTEIMFLGRFEERKGIDVLLEAIPKVLETRPDCHFTLVGDNSIVNHVSGKRFDEEFKAKNPRWLSHVTITGRLDEAEVQRRFREADIFIAPSRFESFGIINVEAMMFKVPLISCAVGGINEVVEHNRTGILVPSGNAEKLVEAIIGLVKNPELQLYLAQNGRKHYEAKYTPESNALQLYNIYIEAIARFNGLKEDEKTVLWELASR